jgi:hypothetical protein
MFGNPYYFNTSTIMPMVVARRKEMDMLTTTQVGNMGSQQSKQPSGVTNLENFIQK